MPPKNSMKINGKEIRRIPDQTGEYLSLNSASGNNGELYITQIPGWPLPFSAEWYKKLSEETERINNS